MKITTAIKFTALTALAAYPCVAMAETFGATLPAIASAGSLFNVFCGALVSLVFITDYTRHNRILVRVAPAAVPVPVTARTEAHRLAA